MIRMTCVVHGTNYYERRRTVEGVGLKGLRVSEVKRYPVSLGQFARLNELWYNISSCHNETRIAKCAYNGTCYG